MSSLLSGGIGRFSDGLPLCVTTACIYCVHTLELALDELSSLTQRAHTPYCHFNSTLNIHIHRPKLYKKR
jgi:hypothetical protein